MENLPPVANFATATAGVVDTGNKFATGVNDTGSKFSAFVNNIDGKLPTVSIAPGANLPPVAAT